MKQFKGRVLAKGNWKGEAIVSHNGVNTLATFQKSIVNRKKVVIGADQNNPDIFNKQLTGKALCLPITIGSTTGGLVIQTICALKSNPSCLLFSEHIDSLAGSGVVLANVWEHSDMIVIDNLGKEFLATVKSGDQIEVKEDGTVVIL